MLDIKLRGEYRSAGLNLRNNLCAVKRSNIFGIKEIFEDLGIDVCRLKKVSRKRI